LMPVSGVRSGDGARLAQACARANLILAGAVTVSRVGELLAWYGRPLKPFNVAAVAGGVKEPLTSAAITGRTFTGTMTVACVLDALGRRRLIRRFPHPAGRRVLVAAAAAGGQACGEILRRPHALGMPWLAGMAGPARPALLRLPGHARGRLGRVQVPPGTTTCRRAGDAC
jgi:hypothetical protein